MYSAGDTMTMADEAGRATRGMAPGSPPPQRQPWGERLLRWLYPDPPAGMTLEMHEAWLRSPPGCRRSVPAWVTVAGLVVAAGAFVGHHWA